MLPPTIYRWGAKGRLRGTARGGPRGENPVDKLAGGNVASRADVSARAAARAQDSTPRSMLRDFARPSATVLAMSVNASRTPPPTIAAAAFGGLVLFGAGIAVSLTLLSEFREDSAAAILMGRQISGGLLLLIGALQVFHTLIFPGGSTRAAAGGAILILAGGIFMNGGSWGLGIGVALICACLLRPQAVSRVLGADGDGDGDGDESNAE